MTNYESIRDEALALATEDTCPEIAADFLVELVSTEKTLTIQTQAITMLIMNCPVFNKFMQKTLKELIALREEKS